MPVLENLFHVLSLFFILGSPLYLLERYRMTNDTNHFSRKFKRSSITLYLTTLFVILSLINSIFILMLISILAEVNFYNFALISLVIGFCVSIGLTYFGGGLYISAILCELRLRHHNKSLNFVKVRKYLYIK